MQPLNELERDGNADHAGKAPDNPKDHSKLVIAGLAAILAAIVLIAIL